MIHKKTVISDKPETEKTSSKPIFAYFKDAACSEPLGDTILDFPDNMTSGDKVSYVFYALNILPKAELFDVEFIPKDKEVTITTDRKECLPKQAVKVTLTFSPKTDREHTFRFTVRTKAIVRPR